MNDFGPALEIARRQALEEAHPYATPLPQGLHTGPIRAVVPGRTDHLPMKVRPDSYVLPADIVSALGEGNTEAGYQVVAGMFPSKEIERAAGGPVVDGGEPMEIIAAGGEYVLSPEQVLLAGEGDIQNGHEVLDHLVKMLRKQHINTLKKLPGPVKE
jgi:hypothetical protein